MRRDVLICLLSIIIGTTVCVCSWQGRLYLESRPLEAQCRAEAPCPICPQTEEARLLELTAEAEKAKAENQEAYEKARNAIKASERIPECYGRNKGETYVCVQLSEDDWRWTHLTP